VRKAYKNHGSCINNYKVLNERSLKKKLVNAKTVLIHGENFFVQGKKKQTTKCLKVLFWRKISGNFSCIYHILRRILGIIESFTQGLDTWLRSFEKKLVDQIASAPMTSFYHSCHLLTTHKSEGFFSIKLHICSRLWIYKRWGMGYLDHDRSAESNDEYYFAKDNHREIIWSKILLDLQ